MLHKEGICIIYVHKLASLPWWQYAIPVIIAVIVIITTKKWKLGALVGYIFFVFTATVLMRRVYALSYKLLPFWSYRDYFNGTDPSLMDQIIANVVMFIPVGFLAGKLIGWKSIWVGLAFSCCIELVQLITGRGLFEFDDIIHNTFGTVIGFGIYSLLRKEKNKICAE